MDAAVSGPASSFPSPRDEMRAQENDQRGQIDAQGKHLMSRSATSRTNRRTLRACSLFSPPDH